MSPSEIAKSYGAKSLKEVAEFHGMSPQWLWKIFKKDFDEFDLLCWKWAKAKASYAPYLRRAFIDGVIALGLSDEQAGNLATMKEYNG